MTRLALKGSLASGKTAVARELVEQGLTLVNFTDYLKQLYADSHDITLQEILDHKEMYRRPLIAYGHKIGFDDDPAYVRGAIQRAGDPENAVFDNVRFPAQMEELQRQGYRLVRFYVPRELIKLRLMVYKGMSREEAEYRMKDETETALDGTWYVGEFEVGNYDRTPAETAETILRTADAFDSLRFPPRAAA